MREETRCCHIGYSLLLTARVLLYAPSNRQDSTYHILCYTRRGALAGARNSSLRSPHEGSIRGPIAPWANALTTELHLAPSDALDSAQSLVVWYIKVVTQNMKVFPKCINDIRPRVKLLGMFVIKYCIMCGVFHMCGLFHMCGVYHMCGVFHMCGETYCRESFVRLAPKLALWG